MDLRQFLPASVLQAPPHVEEKPAFPFTPGQAVRFAGGKYNGFEGTVRFCGPTCASVVIVFEDEPREVVEDAAFLRPLNPQR